MVTLMDCHWSRCKRGQGDTTKKVQKSSTSFIFLSYPIYSIKKAQICLYQNEETIAVAFT